ncbi:superoxide dismutase family protein [Clostridium ganghwense]|uniref:Superoxide dismutase [Cu-Zn] n=1 Tax=Clostridium ganghwense TaxID=312089 RepID=A0ABT4CQL9_9CLOT|nr:superoxide dismutase family protein [Clostridium ganghwense]MCY6370526.1 superoxide dismutase family protein [Clostridium ganghwense]
MYFNCEFLPYYLYSCRIFHKKFCPKYNKNKPIYLAAALIKGGPLAPKIKGIVHFNSVPYGTEVYVCVNGLPDYKPAQNGSKSIGPFGFHLHEEGCCKIGDAANPFTCAKGHYNPTNQPHGNHAGDFPVLFSNNGLAQMCFFTNKFKVSEIIGKAVIIHENPDDFQSQPTGNSGKRLACGIVRACC